MARPNPRDVSTGSVTTTKTEDPPFWGLFEGVFGEPTIYKDTGKDVKSQRTIPVPQTGVVNAQGGCRGQRCNGNDQKTSCWVVYGNELQLTQAAVDYYKNINVPIKKCGETTPVNGVTRQEFEELKQAVWKYDPKTGMTVGTGAQRSITDVWNHLSRWVWGHGGEQWQAGGMAEKWDQPEPTALLPMTLRLHQEQETRLTDAHAHRQSIETKVEDLYTRKADKGHSHNGNGTDWGVVVMGILAIVVILIAVKYLFPLLGGLKGVFSRGGNGESGGFIQ